MNFLIVVPRYNRQPGTHYVFPLGLAYISASLKSRGYRVECLNLNHSGESLETLLHEAIVDRKIDAVCTGGLSMHYKQIKGILDITRRIKRDMVSIVGGGLMSSEPELVMQALGSDFGVIGEGEATIVELAKALSGSGAYTEVSGIIYRDLRGELVTTTPRPPIADIDSIPFPDYEGLGMAEYLAAQMPNDERYLYPFDRPRNLPVISSRSCPYNCTFCYHPIGKKYRKRSLDGFFEEVEYVVERYDVNTLMILDELFSNDRRRLEEFCERISECGIKWQAQVRVDLVDEELLRLMKSAGCYLVNYGLESASKTILDSMKKHINLADIEKATHLTHEAEMGIQGNFLFGDKAETRETVCESLKWWLQHRDYQLYLIPIEVYPGSELYRYAVSNGIIQDRLKHLENRCPSVNLTAMDSGEYLQMLTVVYLLMLTYQYFPAEITACEPQEKDPYGRTYFTVELLCPHCGQAVRYRNMAEKGHIKIGCRACNRRLDMPLFGGYAEKAPLYDIAAAYTYSPAHGEEIAQILAGGPNSWRVGSGPGYDIVRLLGKYYGIPRFTDLNALRYFGVPVVIGSSLEEVKARMKLSHVLLPLAGTMIRSLQSLLSPTQESALLHLGRRIYRWLASF